MSGEVKRDYVCTDCGSALFTAAGPFAPIDIWIACKRRGCKRWNRVQLGAEQVITPAMLHRWRERKHRFEAAAMAS